MRSQRIEKHESRYGEEEWLCFTSDLGDDGAVMNLPGHELYDGMIVIDNDDGAQLTLNRRQVEALVNHLQAWLKTGSLEAGK